LNSQLAHDPSSRGREPEGVLPCLCAEGWGRAAPRQQVIAHVARPTLMLSVVLACALLVTSTTLVHYEVLGALNKGLHSLAIPNRSKLLVVIVAAFCAHAVEMCVYGAALYLLIEQFRIGSLDGAIHVSLLNCLYFSAETYTSLGFGDLTPVGPVRLLAGVEALNGLLLIGWSASYTYIAMERFWSADKADGSE